MTQTGLGLEAQRPGTMAHLVGVVNSLHFTGPKLLLLGDVCKVASTEVLTGILGLHDVLFRDMWVSTGSRS